MAEDGIWPMPRFSFLVELGDGIKGGFSEIGGLDSETQAIEYRRSGAPLFSTMKMPGLRKYAEVVLKRGLLAADPGVAEWLKGSMLGKTAPRDVIVRLRDEKGATVAAWILVGAWPTRISGPGPGEAADEIPIETLELACEQVVAREP